MFDFNHGIFEYKFKLTFYDNFMTLLLQLYDKIQPKSFEFSLKKLIFNMFSKKNNIFLNFFYNN